MSSNQSGSRLQDRDALAGVVVAWALARLEFFPINIPPEVFLGLAIAVLGWSVVNGN